jgi:type IV pilus assembly protein PilA
MSGRAAPANLRASAAARGFTLVELLVVVGMIGVLAALAIVGYRKWLMSARSAEPRGIIQQIRGEEESIRHETLGYLNCSSSLQNDWYPNTNPTTNLGTNWKNPQHIEWPCWSRMHISADAPTHFGYSVMAGAPGAAMPAANSNFANPPIWPVPTEPWYVVEAGADRDNNGTWALFIGSSLKGQDIYFENETE